MRHKLFINGYADKHCYIFIYTREWELLYKVLARIVLIPVIAGIAYEFIKLSSKKMHHRFIRYLILPGLWLQRLTTREPTDEQIEVAIRALKEAVAIEPVIN